MPNTVPVPVESVEQTCLFHWAQRQSGAYPALSLMFHIPNGGSRHKVEARKLKEQGVKAGVPDVCLPVARGGYHGLYVELKRIKGGKVSSDQQDWIKALAAEGYMAVVCRGWNEAAEAILKYLRQEEYIPW